MNTQPLPESGASQPGRRWFQFSLRGLLGAMTLVAVGIGIFEHRFERPRRAIAAIEEAGGIVGYENRRNEKPGRVEAWLRERLPRCYFDPVVEMKASYWSKDLDLPYASAACLPYLAELRSLRKVDLGFYHSLKDELNNDNLAHIARVAALRELYLGGADEIGDEGIAHLARCTALEKLDLSGTTISDAGLKHLASLTSLRELYLGKTAIGDEGLSHLKNLTSLEVLELSQTRVTDAGMPIVASFTSLRELDLGRTSVGDPGVEHLCGLKALKRLRLSETQLSDAGLIFLASVNSLTDLRLNNVCISDAGVAHLRQLILLDRLGIPDAISDYELDLFQRCLPRCDLKQNNWYYGLFLLRHYGFAEPAFGGFEAHSAPSSGEFFSSELFELHCENNSQKKKWQATTRNKNE